MQTMAASEATLSAELKALVKQHEAYKIKAAEEQQLVEVRLLLLLLLSQSSPANCLSRNSWDYYNKRNSHSRTSNPTSTTKLKAVAAGRSVRLTPNRVLFVEILTHVDR